MIITNDDKFKIKYSKKDNYSVNLYNLHKSTFTY